MRQNTLEKIAENIEGKISTEDVRHRLEEYYQQKDVREKAEADRTLEADGVSERQSRNYGDTLSGTRQ